MHSHLMWLIHWFSFHSSLHRIEIINAGISGVNREIQILLNTFLKFSDFIIHCTQSFDIKHVWFKFHWVQYVRGLLLRHVDVRVVCNGVVSKSTGQDTLSKSKVISCKVLLLHMLVFWWDIGVVSVHVQLNLMIG